MDVEERHKKIIEIVEQKLTCSAHNLDHVFRVYNLCLLLAKYEKDVDLEILIPSALLHDIARVEESQDKTGKIDHAVLGSIMAEEILKKLEYEEEKIEKIKHCIVAHRFRTGNEPNSIEAKILFDADKLDVIGASGIARTFMLAGQFGQRLIDNDSLNEYMNSNTVENGRLKDVSKHTPFIEYEVKFKKIPNKLYIEKAKEIGKERLKFMDEYFNRLKSEIDGIK
ncbi:HD domain-containing protein [Clostridium sp. YIM B02555]|uniref:HD domain-containing protein n=1 Tax=Clostridium sp. YIM B02555 TaxID=2911968 RepID=UPI001EEF3B96|nr:HD domain-containing protein [Clostridium sp. YIM B02555]